MVASGRLAPARGERPAHAAFRLPVRVYYEDTDSGGVVYYANYLKFMERARSEWLRHLGFEQSELARDVGIIFVVCSAAVDYLKPAHIDDVLEVTVELGALGRSQMLFLQKVLRGQTTLVSGQIRVVCVNAASFKPVKIPGHIKERLAEKP